MTKAEQFQRALYHGTGWVDDEDTIIFTSEWSLREACTSAEKFGITNLVYNGPLNDKNKRCNWTFTFDDGSTTTASFSLY